MSKPIYLDYNATTPIDPRVADAMRPFIENYFGNPSCAHQYGQETKEAVARARSQAASLFGCQADEIIFTSGGTEANNYALKGTAWALKDKGNHIITSVVEHPAVIEVCRYLEQNGFEVTYLPVDRLGMIDVNQLAEAITARTILITIMQANNEVGTIEPIEEISCLARERSILFHSDCAQSIGKIPARVDDLGLDLLSVAGHKLYAPKGVGLLYVRDGVKLEKFMHGAGHEGNRRAGTENVIQVVGLGEACRIIDEDDLTEHAAHLKSLRDRLEAGIAEHVSDFAINGHPDKRLPNTSSIGFSGRIAEKIMAKMPNVAVSAGAACHGGGVTISSVLEAMQVPKEFAIGTLRFSVGRFTTESEIDLAVEEISKAVAV